jgi:two-component system, sensor histidine kinase and response regulator
MGKERIMSHVLVVDDEESIRLTMAVFLRKAGYIVEVTDDAAKAQQLLKEKKLDVVLSDIVMPRITGTELLHLIRRESPDVQVIMMTGQPTVETAAAAVRAGAFDYLIKPVGKEQILRCVGNAAKLKAAEDERRRLAEDNRRHLEELKASYERLRESETLRDNLVHMIIHDLRSPLAMIQGYLNLLKGPLPQKLNPVEMDHFDIIYKQTHKMIAMVSSIVDVSRLEANQMPLNRQPHDLASLARSVMNSIGSLAGQRRLNLEAPPEPVTAHADKGLIERVIVNLLANALRFTPDAGEVRIAVSGNPSSARMRVTDTGTGIDPKYHKRIFEKFGAMDKGTRGYSTGLGLAFCKLAVEAHGGRIGLESAIGEGSTFWFELPAH